MSTETEKENLFDVWLRLKPYSPYKKREHSPPLKPFRVTLNANSSSTKKSTISNTTNFQSISKSRTTKKSPRITANDLHLLKTDYKAVTLQENGTLLINRRRVISRDKFKKEGKVIKFPSIYGDESNNKEIFQNILKKKVKNAFEGVGFSMITYGISGSGKTHTIFGSQKSDGEWEDGMVFMTAKQLFKEKKRKENKEGCIFKVKASFIEIYNENVYDLLSEHSEKKLNVVDNLIKTGVTINDLEMKEVRNFEELKRTIQKAQSKRVVCPSLNNHMSSR